MANHATIDHIPNSAHGLFRPHVARASDLARSFDPGEVLRDQAFLTAFLPYAVAQSRRHVEPVSILCVAADRLAAIEDLLGPGLAETALRRVSETVARALRTSDVVARFDDNRLVAVLPHAGAADVPMIAEAVRKAVFEIGKPTTSMPRLTVTIGTATYPDNANNADNLLTAAVEALERARGLGANRIVTSKRTPFE